MRVSVISASIDPRASLIEEHPFIAAVKTASPSGRRAEPDDGRRRERLCDFLRMRANGKTAIAKIRPNRLCQNA